MKKTAIILTAAAMTLFAACDKTEIAKPVDAQLKFVSTTTDVPLPDAFKVKMVNEEGVATFDETITPTNGIVTVPGVTPGIYNISVSAEKAYAGKAYTFVGNKSNCPITAESLEVEIELSYNEASALVIKELFYALGANSPEITNYREDNFWEIYNNSTIDQPLDGLCIADLAPTNASSIYKWELDDTKYVFCNAIWQIPGTGNQYVLKPGESAVIAAVAIDHTALTTKTVDLSKADFETYIPSQTLYADNPNVPNMKLLFGSFGTGRERYNICAMGAAVVLFSPNGTIDNSTSVSPIGGTDICKEIPVEWVIDGIEAVQTEKDIQYKRVPESIDAGATYVHSVEYEPFPDLLPGYKMTQSNHNGESVYRKVKETVNGIKVYQDTNNSSNDFEAGPAVVRRDGAGVPSWSPAK